MLRIAYLKSNYRNYTCKFNWKQLMCYLKTACVNIEHKGGAHIPYLYPSPQGGYDH